MNTRKRILSPIALLGAVAVIAVAAVAGLTVFGDDDDTSAKRGATDTTALRLNGPEIAPFRLTVPAGWERVDQKLVEKSGQTNAIAVKKNDGSGLLTVKVEGPLKQNLTSLRKSLVRAVDKRSPDMKLTASRTVDVAAGPAVYTAWSTKGGKSVTTNLVVPDGKITYSVDAVVDAQALQTAAEVGRVLSDFDTNR